MRNSRGMGAIKASKMPKGATIARKDNPNKVRVFRKGGMVKKADGGDVEFERTPADISSDITAPESSFKDAFRDARASGDKTFTWKGKSYNTSLASDKPKAAAKPATAAKPAAKASAPAPKAVTPSKAKTGSASAPKTTGQMYKDMMSESRAGQKADAAARRASAPTFSERMHAQFTTSPAEQAAFDRRQAKARERGDSMAKSIKDVAATIRGKADPKPKQPSSQVKGRAPAVGAAAKARRAEYDKEGYAKGGWIKDAIKKPGALRAELGATKGKPIPAKKLAAAAKAPGKLGQRARFAETLKKMRKK